MLEGKVISVTGHRPDKLGGYEKDAFLLLAEFAGEVLSEVKPAKVLTGMAIGWDQAVALACWRLKIPYVPCIPFKGQELRWKPWQQDMYHRLVNGAKPIEPVYVCDPPYFAWKMYKRNEYMVEHSDGLLALYDGGPKGGTASCVAYAIQQERDILNVWDRYTRFMRQRR